MTLATSRRPLLALAALTTLALGACVGDGDGLITTTANPVPGGALFARYVSLGNSITAGFQSGGIADSLQLRAYPVLLAARAGATFNAPTLAGPGCPRPFTAPLTPAAAAPPGSPCFRTTTPLYVSNLAVPGMRIRDLFAIPANAFAPLYTLITGGRSQAQAMIDAQPSFVSVWIGNNDALSAAIGGNLGPAAAGLDSLLTPLAAFQASVAQMVTDIRASGAQGAAIIGVVNPALGAPILQPGAYFFLARDPATGRFNGKLVNNNCSPVTALGQPNPLAANLVSFQIVADANFPEINCDPAAYPVGDPRRGVHLLDTAEQVFVATRIAAYNAALQAAAAANNWAYLDPNVILATLRAEKDVAGRYQRLRKCQDLATATTAAQFQAAVLLSCPVTGPTAAPGFFGSLISFDGVHPSSEAHRVFTGVLAAAINARYGTTLSTSQT
ncbi:MAG TPA: SGNH/GDSL hydrolase family protein [Longimicrobiaceae bacterium]|nr:SGNH/GDSL hydrolase family protein [Longimicrobiaceae bacterium]